MEPPKRPGTARRGSKLTRIGLLHRYHALLIGELETLSWNLYGDRDFALRMRPQDQAVDRRCNSGYVNGKFKFDSRRKRYAFFDESKLTTRARTVLASLKIDTVKAGDLP